MNDSLAKSIMIALTCPEDKLETEDEKKIRCLLRQVYGNLGVQALIKYARESPDLQAFKKQYEL